jgi:hypothetical protein
MFEKFERLTFFYVLKIVDLVTMVLTSYVFFTQKNSSRSYFFYFVTSVSCFNYMEKCLRHILADTLVDIIRSVPTFPDSINS